MAYAKVQQSSLLSTQTGGTLSWTPGTAPTVGNLLNGSWANEGVVMAAGDCKDSSGTPVTFTLDSPATADAGANHDNASIHSLVVPSGLTTPIKQANTSTFKSGIFQEWSGGPTTSVVDASSQNHVATDTVTAGDTGGLNTGANVGLVLAVINNYFNGTTPSSGGGANWVADSTDTTLSSQEAHDVTSVASQTGLKDSWTWTGASRYAAVAVSYNLSGGGGAVVEISHLLMLGCT